MNKASVAYQRGKRSCTLEDIKSKGKQNIPGNSKSPQSKGQNVKSLAE